MKRIAQSLEGIKNSLSIVETDWRDEHIFDVESLFEILNHYDTSTDELLKHLFNVDFNAAKTLIRAC